MLNTLKKPTSIIIGGLTLSVVALGLIALHNPTPIVPKAEASFPPEAVSIANSIKQDILVYGSGAALVQKGTDMIRTSEAAAKGRDLVLCAQYKLRYDRELQKLVTDLNCPLL